MLASRLVRHLATLLLCGLLPGLALAVDFDSVQSGPWTSPATWGGSVPDATAEVFISPGHTVTLDVPVSPLGLRLGGSATLQVEGTGAVTLCTGCTLWNDGTLAIAGAVTLGSGVAVSEDYHNGASILVQPGGEFLVRQFASLSHATGTITNQGLMTVDGHVQIRLNGPTTLANHGTLEVNGTITNQSRMQNTGTITVGRVDLGAGLINNERLFTTTGGSVEILPGAYFAAGGFTATDNAVVTNRNRFSLTGGIAQFSDGATFHNHAELHVVGGGTLLVDPGSTFYNHCDGTFDPEVVWGTVVYACALPPTVTQTGASSIGGDRARLAGNVTGAGGAPVSVRGFVVAQTSLDANPLLGGTHVSTFDSSDAAVGTYAVWAEGLVPGRGYSFKAYVTNAAGVTAYSTVATFTTLATPDAPTIGTAVAGDGFATVHFTPPANAGGAPITHYYAVGEPGAVMGEQCTQSPCHVFGLANGSTYRFRAIAVSAIGASPASALSNAITPTGGNTPPLISAVANPAFLEGGSATVQFTVSDDATAAGDIVVSVSSSNVFDDAALNAGLGGSGGARTLLLQPHPDAWGTAQVTLHATDGNGASATRTFEVDIAAVNDAPRVTLGADPSYPSGASGTRLLPGFATAQDGLLEFGNITLSIAVEADTDGLLSSVGIDAFGNVTLALAGQDGIATVRVTAQDDGGTEHGGSDTGSDTFRVRVGSAPEGGVTLDVRRIAPPPGEVALMYAVSVVNDGAEAFTNATLDVVAPRLQGVQWTCSIDTGSCTPAAGNGAARVRFGLVPGGNTIVLVEGAVPPATDFVEVTATLDAPDDVGGRQRAVLVDPVSADALFGAGFE